MKKKRILYILAALLMAAITLFSACSGRRDEASGTANPFDGKDAAATLVPTAEPTPVPTAEPTAAPADDPRLKAPLDNICRFIEEPNTDTLGKLYPADFFAGLKSVMDSTLETAGMTYEHFGYSDFEGFLEGMLKDLDFSGYVGTQGINDVEKADYVINSCERADIGFVIDKLKGLISYLDPESITSAYKLEVDFNFEGEGRTASNDAELYLYEYKGEFFVLFAE